MESEVEGIVLLSERAEVSDLPAPGVVCDAYVRGAEDGEPFPWGWRLGAVDNVDHHASDPRFRRFVSSANLALAYCVAPADTPVYITHTDCDSILSAAMVRGLIPLEERFGDAALAADHTGDRNALADPLQALESRRDLALSLRTMRAILSGEPLEPDAQAAAQERVQERFAAEEAVSLGAFQCRGGFAFARLPYRIDGSFFVSLLPTARLIATFSERAGGILVAKLRLGLAAPIGASLHQLGIQAFDPNYGGRWNAGSNRRGGGTHHSLEEYVSFLESALPALDRNGES